MCPCSCGADKISPVLIEKLQMVRNINGRPVIITSGVRCEFYDTSIKASTSSSHILDDYGIGNAVDIACLNSKDRYELVEVAQKFFKRIGISGGSYEGVFIWMLIDLRFKKSCGFVKDVSPSFKPNQESKKFSRGTSREELMATK